MPYYVRPMQNEDIPQVKIIDREAFPTMLPPPNFERELRNQMTHYYVVCDDQKYIEQEVSDPAVNQSGNFFSKVKNLLFPDEQNPKDDSVKKEKYPVVYGYVGFWIMADEAHITTIAVKEDFQRMGIGELLMMAVVNRAEELYATVVTLEVRVSNTGAQKMYLKYGFSEVGVRKHYYTDNREDAYIMTTENITSVAYKNLMGTLADEHKRRWGKARFSGIKG